MSGNLGSWPPRVKHKIELELSQGAYDEIVKAMRDAGYGVRVNRNGHISLNDVTVMQAEPVLELNFNK